MNQQMQPMILDQVQSMLPEMREVRRAFHQIPELGNQEFKTTAAIEHFLRDLGLEPYRLLETGVVCDIVGGAFLDTPAAASPLVALRADIDALPIVETTGLPFASRHDGRMHACGHDLHLTAALFVAKYLVDHRDLLPGTVRLLFQPDEEGEGGAERLIAAGALDDVQAVFGLHGNPDLPAGTVGVKYGAFYAASARWDVQVDGVSAHGAERAHGRDALLAAADLAVQLDALNGLFEGESLVVTTGTFEAGQARNIIAATARLTGIARTFGQERLAAAHEAFDAIVARVAAAHGVSIDLSWIDGYVGVTNHDTEVDLVCEVATQVLGADKVIVLDAPTYTTEDFGYYILDRPGCFYHLGVGSAYPLHSDKFCPDEEALPVAVATHTAVLISMLEHLCG